MADFIDSGAAFADPNEQLAEFEKQQKLALLLRAQQLKRDPGAQPEGEMVGGHYVAPAMTQRLSAMLKGFEQNQAAKAAQAQLAQAIQAKQQMEAQQSQQAEDWRNSIPRAIPAQAGTAPPDELGGGPPTEGTPAQPVTPEQERDWLLQGYGNPKSAPQATVFQKYFEQKQSREDAQTEAQNVLKQTIAAQAARDAANAAAKIDAQTKHDETLKAIAEGRNKTQITIKGMGGGDGPSGGAAKLPVSAQKHQRALLDLESGLNDYEKLLENYNPQGSTAVSPTERKRIGSAFTDYQMRLKNAYELGAITGPDMKVLNEAVTNPVSALGTLEFGITGKGPLKAQLSEARKSLNRQRANFEVQYGIPVGDAYGGQWEETTPKPAVKPKGGPVKWGDLK